MLASAPSATGRGVPDAGSARFVRASLLIFFTYVFLSNAWIGDDAHITFKTVWNAVHGYGLTYNPDERVQAYTHPLWMMAIAGVHAVTREFFFSVTALSWACSVAAGVLLLRLARTPRATVLMAVWLMSSKALVDYTSSGLEYPLSYLLIAIFYVRYLDRATDSPPTCRDLQFFAFVSSLAFVNRSDTSLLFVLPVADLTVRALRAQGRTVIRPILVGAAPAALWLLFATFYYGFPLPNTYYAKVANGIPAWLERQQGWAYLLNSISHDPLTLGTVALAVLGAWHRRGAPRLAALSALLYVAYTVNVGGDFMSGRFFAMPFLLAVMATVPSVEDSLAPWVGTGLVIYNLMMPIVPVKTTARYDGAWPWSSQNGIKDERGYAHQGSNILAYAPFRNLPDLPFGREGLSFAAGEQKSAVYCCIGLYGLNAGPEKHVIDDNALSDPLLARLPVSPRVYFDFWASHYFRDLPEGYAESVERGQNLLTDPRLHEYYEKMRNVTRGPLLRMSRLADIWSLNVHYRHLQDDYDKRRPVALSIPANHVRFQTDVGIRDDGATVLRATGRAGYLQLGPGIPLREGFYRARWVATVEDAADGRLGVVEVWSDGRRIARQFVTHRAPSAAHERVAQADFTLSAPSRSVEYRFYVNAGVRMSLERVELFSGLAIPPDAGPE